MAKISPVAGKYVIHATIHIDGVVDRPDIIGAVFGQTEGLLGAELELRELQRTGRIGRIEVNTESRNGKTAGQIIIPSSLDKTHTAIVAASLEIIERIGPCTSSLRVDRIEDIRILKRNQVVARAKELLRAMHDTTDDVLTDISHEVSDSVKVEDVVEYGPDKLSAGPDIDASAEVIIVEGRADVLALLKHGFTNVIAMNGTTSSPTILDLCAKKTVTLFVDGDRGGMLNVKELMSMAKVDYIAKAPDGKEVEELTSKEIHKALRAKIIPSQMKNELESKDSLRERISMPEFREVPRENPRERNGAPEFDRSKRREDPRRRFGRSPKATEGQLHRFSVILDEIASSGQISILDQNLEVLGKVPITDAVSTIETLEGVAYAVVVDGTLSADMGHAASKAKLSFLVGKASDIRQQDCRAGIVLIQ